MATNLSHLEREGLTIWALLYGTNQVDFETLRASGLTGYFILEDAQNEGYLNRVTDESYHAIYNLTDSAMALVKGERDDSNN
jgi:hypothetical protein